MVEGPTIMLGVFITLLYTHTMPNIYYCSTCMLLYPHLMAKLVWDSWQKIKIFSWSEAWNLPTWGCKSMVEGPTIMLGVFITLLYTHTMPNNHYCSTCMLLYPHLMAKHCLKVGRNRDFFHSDLRHETRQHGAVKVWMEGLTIMLGVFITLLYTHTMPNNHYCSTCMLCYTPTWWPNIAWKWQKSRFFPDLRHETRQHGAVKVWMEGLTIMLGVFITLLYTHTMPNIYYCSTCMLCYTPTWWPNIAWEVGRKFEIFSWSEAWNPPTWGCKSMVEGPTIMLGVFITLLYTHTMPNIYYCSSLHAVLYPHLMAKHCLRSWQKIRDFFLIWGMKPANMGL